jgi:mono/diheme cytochrome c family protein
MNRIFFKLVGGSVLLVVAAMALWSVSSETAASANPPLQDNSAIPIGKAIYETKCATCHGMEGDGQGAPAAFLNPKPRDFTEGKYKFRTTESGSIPTDDDIVRSIKVGLHSTSMPDWEPFLSPESIRAVVEYVKGFSERFKTEKPMVVTAGTPIPSSAGSIAQGKRVYATLQCGACHGTDGKGTDAIQKEFTDDWGNEIVATNLSEPWTFRGGATPRDIYLRFRTGIDGSPMPSYKGSASDAEMWHLANYVLSLARKPIWEMNEQELLTHFDMVDQQAKADPVKRGRYLVEAGGCADCHSTFSNEGVLVKELKLAGGMTFDLPPFGRYTTRNLTSDNETGLGDWTDEEILRVFNQGITRDGRKLLPFPMPWVSLSQLSETDQRAITAYLRTLPPVTNKIPDPEKPNIFSYLWGKFRMLILKEQIPARLYLNAEQRAMGDGGTPVNPVSPHSAKRDFTQSLAGKEN